MDNKPKVKITETERMKTPKPGLQDCDKIFVDCGDCNETLMEFKIPKSNADFASQSKPPVSVVVQVRCSICGGASYQQTIDGMFYPGAAADDMGFEPLDDEIVNGVDFIFRAWRK